MTDNVVRLDGGERLLVGEPDPHVVATLEDLLAEAKSGKLMTFAMVAFASDGFIRCCWRGQTPATSVLGGLRRLEYDMLRAIGEEECK